jgi:argininosuccinate synthase
MKAHQAVESLTLDREVAHMKEGLALKFAEHTYNGFWFAPEAVLVRKFIDFTQHSVTGWAKLKLYKGNVTVVARHAESSLYDHKMSSFEEMGIFNQSDSGGFININGLRLTAWSKCNESIEKSLQGTT